MMILDKTYTRRSFLTASSAASLAALVPAPLKEQRLLSKALPATEIPSRDSLLKFNPDGSARHFAGNTVICHLPQQSMVHDAIAALGEALRSGPLAPNFAMLPPESYHVTVFSGANDLERTRDTWPSDVPIEAPMAECNRIVGERLASFHTGSELPLRVSVSPENTVANATACSLRLVPADAAENTKLRRLRDRISDAYRFRAADHESYDFHITVAYQMRRFTARQQAQYEAILSEHLPRIVRAAPVIELGEPEFCTFEDMYRFEVRTLLRT